jgi:hypothetical protein
LRSGDYDGGIVTDADDLLIAGGRLGYVMQWRREQFGVEPPQALAEEHIRIALGDRYHTSFNPYYPEWRRALPSGSERSWRRGTWSPVPVTWLDRATEIYAEICAERMRT